MSANDIRTIVLAYSGGLDTTAMVPWLREHYDADVVCVMGNVGQEEDDVAGAAARAREAGARDCFVLDLQEVFLESYAFPTLLTGGVYEGRYLLGTATARPPIARAIALVARDVGADALAHGCTGKGNDQVRFETAWAVFAPHLPVIAPWRTWSFKGRQDVLDYITSKGLDLSGSATKEYSRDGNIWHISHEGGALEDPSLPPPDDIWMRTADIDDTPAVPEDITITFEHGRPRAVNGVRMRATALLADLNARAGKHGVGRIDIVENRLVGMKSRGCYETPGGTVIVEALRGLEEIVLDRATLHWRESIGLRFADLVYDGLWFSPLREAMSAAAESIAQRLTGDVTVRLYRGQVTTRCRTSPCSLYSEAHATFEADEVCTQAHAEGFIRYHSLSCRIAALGLGRPTEGEDAAIDAGVAAAAAL